MSGGAPRPSRPKRPSPRVLRRRRFIVGLIAVLAIALVAVVTTTTIHALSGQAEPRATARHRLPTSTPTPTPTPLTPAEALLKTATDPRACALSFAGDGVAQAPMLQTEGVLYTGLPILERPGSVFAGWYPSAAQAQAQTQTDRVNGSQLATCADRQRTLYAAWTTPEQNSATAAKIPILMYHQFTTKPEGEDGWLHKNYVYIEDFKKHMAYVAAQKFYLPTWDELNAFIDGKLFLPQHSLIITDDDADPTWLQLAVPVVTDDKLLTTSFVITNVRHDGSPSPYVLQRSHTDSMHTAGANGKGQMVNLSADQIAADLEKSAQILGGVKEVIAYPYGHYNATAEEGVTKAGFLLARTIEHGYVTIGTPKLELPVIRINYGDTVDDLKANIG
ncbi:polysaccharide deacetylase family protein [uncultured Microbacterium sp.]|uniref:polysaccharide deacetylase family protein n=1 Tax=uncultured Microbacterium sp. TaxID=191216 RepID=UPI0025F83660|nr:polysaccharide deacetylase family protein [uncultured Microbacterium sp.]